MKKIVLNKKTIEVDEDYDDAIQLKVNKILPSNAKNKKIVWETDDEDVADVDNKGTVIIGEAGEVTITAYAADDGGAYAECEVIVNEDDDDYEDDGDDYDYEDDYDEDEDEDDYED